MSIIKRYKQEFYQESLFCECGQKLDDNNNKYISIERKTLYKDIKLPYGGIHQEIIGKIYICPKCGKEHQFDEFPIFPKNICRLIEITD